MMLKNFLQHIKFMFTGIIQKQIKLRNIKKQNDILCMSFELPKIKNSKLILGGSVSINGVCSTVVKIDKAEFFVEYMQETISKTTVRNWSKGDVINFENSLKVGDTLDGHFVYGHIDAVGKIVSIKEGDSRILEISIPKEFLKYVVYKGSVAVDGVSLTVSKIGKISFEVSLIPHTLVVTNLSKIKVGGTVNIETDALGKYVINNK